MKKSILFISLLFSLSGWAQPRINGGWEQFGIQNPDTVIHLNVSEIATNNKSRLFYADGRQEVSISLRMMCHTLGTEQVFICKEGRSGELFADLAVGYDNTQHRIFAEVKDKAGNPRRIATAQPTNKDVWYDVNVTCTYNATTGMSTMKLSVKESADKQAARTTSLEYQGYAIPHRVGRWVI
jgi:hypothetical protein